MDDDGRVRRASVNTFGDLRPLGGKFTEDMYAELFLTIQDMFDEETNKKKKSSINQALNKLYCPLLESILERRGFVPIEDNDMPHAI